jgi:hypothetical protein
MPTTSKQQRLAGDNPSRDEWAHNGEHQEQHRNHICHKPSSTWPGLESRCVSPESAVVLHQVMHYKCAWDSDDETHGKRASAFNKQRRKNKGQCECKPHDSHEQDDGRAPVVTHARPRVSHTKYSPDNIQEVVKEFHRTVRFACEPRKLMLVLPISALHGNSRRIQSHKENVTSTADSKSGRD